MTATDADDRAARWLQALDEALTRADAGAALDLFDATCFWRDVVSFTWNLHTAEGGDAIAAMLGSTLDATRPRDFALDGAARVVDGLTEAWFTFATRAGRGKGHLRLTGDRCRTLLTTLQSLDGFEEKTGRNDTRERGVEHVASRGRESWLERRRREAAEIGRSRQPYCLIVGGGQGGIALAARLRRLGVPALVIEKSARAGDSWRRRYRSLCLHDPVWYDHLPYLPFPDHWPVFSPKDKLGDWLEAYVQLMEIDYWSATECAGARYDETAQAWEVDVVRDGEPLTVHPRHLVLATGMSGVPNTPGLAGVESFGGTLCHSSGYAGGADWRDRDCVVLGSNNSAHDICADLWEHGARVTMVQRSSTIVVRSEALMKHAWGPLYSEAAVKAGITTELADLTVASVPYRLLPGRQRPVYERIRAEDAALYAGLERAGFLHDFGEDGAGIHAAYLRRGGGYYIDVGASQLIADGEIALESPTTIERVDTRSVILANGRELPADLVVCATGYGPMNDWAARLISPEVAARVGRCWGLGSGTRGDPGPWEGELRNMWKPTRQPGLWFHGGNLMQSRHYSLYLALQLKARMEGIPTPVYGLAPVHHRR